jgi:hypothetical protein
MIVVTTKENDIRPTIEFSFSLLFEIHYGFKNHTIFYCKISKCRAKSNNGPNSYLLKQFNHDRIALAPFSHEQSSIMSWATPSTQIGDTP